MTEPCNVLFLCTGNSARSILAEAVLNAAGAGRFRGFSAGSHPAGRVNPLAIELLEQRHIDTSGLRSKSWDEFSGPDAPTMDLIITVCDNAAGEACPLWPGHPATAHWGMPDPAAADGNDQQRREAFMEAFSVLSTRIRQLLDLRVGLLERDVLTKRLADIGQRP